MNLINIFSISGILNGVSCFLLGLFVFLRDKKNEIFSAYFRHAVAISAWSIGYCFWPVVSDKTIALNIFRYLHLGAVFVSITYYHFISAWAGEVNTRRISLKIGYVLAIIFCLSVPTRFFVYSVEPRFIFKFWGIPGPAYHLFLLFFCYYILAALFIIIKKLRVSQGATRVQCKYLLAGTIIGYIGGCINFPLYYNIPIYPVLNIFVAVYIGVLAYAIVRHKLLNIEVIVKKTLVFAGLLAVVFGILVVPVLIIQEYAARQIDFTGRLVGLAISGIIIIFAIKKIEAFLVEITDKFLFQKKYSYKELLKTFSGEVLTVLEMDKLLDITVSKLSEIIKLHNCAILVFDENSGAFRCQTSTDATMRGAVVPKKLLGDLKGHILRSELGAADSTTLDVMDKFKAGLLIPLAFHDRPIALLALGNKKSDEDYTKDDLDILIPLGQTLAIAISNAKLFDELAKKRSELAQKDKMATIGTLAAGMAHEIRNPITTIRTFADFLPEKYDDSAFMQKFSKLIPLEIERVDTIARSLLEFSSESNMATEREAVDLAGVIRKNIELLRPQYKLSDINVSFDTGERARLEANAQQINDAIFYIVKYIYAESPKNADVSVAALAGANTAEVRFVISARIITDHVIKDIFDPVSETRPEKRGFGFELFIAKRLIEKNDGVFSIYVDPAARTEFRIDFR